MNSDFIQQQAEKLARALEPEADNAARIRKAYRTLFGRDPAPAELSAGLEYLSAEPLRTYEERRKKDEAKKEEDRKKGADGAKPAETKKPEEKPQMGDGMMAGVTKPGGAPEDEQKKLLPVTPLGRYLKVLLSSNEFLFID
jgi:hypothetical protein